MKEPNYISTWVTWGKCVKVHAMRKDFTIVCGAAVPAKFHTAPVSMPHCELCEKKVKKRTEGK